MPDLIYSNLGWWIFGAILLAALVVGFTDFLRFSIQRIMAIASVVWTEAMRKRVLLITPLAIVGVVIIAQFQQPVDAQDAIRQTTKFCLFATGLLVAITAIILAATNLPKEIENRVIYTVVTKPTTRLELVLGKVLGFAMVSAAILLIMGVFTWGYLLIRQTTLTAGINAELESGRVDPISRQTLQHYATAGLLQASTFDRPSLLNIYSRLPAEGDEVRWFYGNHEQDCVIPFEVKPSQLIAPGDPTQTPGANGLLIVANVGYEQHDPSAEEWQQIEAQRAAEEAAARAATQPAPTTNPMLGPMGPQMPATSPATAPVAAAALPPPPLPPPATQPERKPDDPAKKSLPTPAVAFTILDRNLNPLGTPQDVNGGKPATLLPAYMGQPASGVVAPTLAGQIANAGRIWVQISGATPSTEFSLNLEKPMLLLAPGLQPNTGIPIYPAGSPIFRGRSGTYGQQLRGGSRGQQPVAVYEFRGATLGSDAQGNVPFQFRAGIERSGAETTDEDVPTDLRVQVVNRKNGQASSEIDVKPESNRPAYFSVPRASVEGGDFDLLLRNHTDGHWIGLFGPNPAIGSMGSLTLVTGSQPFVFNLFKSLLILWLMAVLIIAIAIFCSTFLSWPIAIILTLVILLGRWGVMQLGDATAPGIGAQIATDLGFRDPAKNKVISTGVEALSKSLNVMARILPDITKFPATENIERGISIPLADIKGALGVALGFGVPLMILSYIFLKFKEVAP